MSLQTAVNERILQRILDEAIRRGDVTMRLDEDGIPRYSAKVDQGVPSDGLRIPT